MNPYEIAARSVYLMAEVVTYCSRDEVERGEIDVKHRIARGETLSNMLDEWQQNLPIEFNTLPLASQAPAVFQPIWVHPPAFGMYIKESCEGTELTSS